MAAPFETFSAGLNPEARLLLNCARTQMDAAHVEQIQALLHHDIDWDSLLEMAYQHNVAPLLYRSLESVAPAALPEWVRVELKGQIQVEMQGNLSLTRELLYLLRLFDQHGIPALPYKGPVLAASIYHDLAVRSFGDLDILVHEEDVLRTVELLVSCGYEVIRPRSVAHRRKSLQLSWISRLVHKSPRSYQLVLRAPDRQNLIELHWRVTSKYVFPGKPGQLWTDLRPIMLGGSTILSFAPENLLWFLCLHGTKHEWKQLRWVCDIAELIREYPDLNWDQVLEQVVALGLERRLYLGLLLANWMLGAPMSSAIETKIHTSPVVRVLAQQVMEGFFVAKAQTVAFPYVRQLSFQFKAIDHAVDRGWYFWGFFNGLNPLRRLLKVDSE